MISLADLHCHSTHSDGSLTPAELIGLAKEKNLKGLAITDHDSFTSFLPAYSLAKKAGIELIPGVEFSAQHKGLNVHVLAYSFDYTSRRLIELCSRHKLRRKERNMEILDKLAKEGFLIDPKELPQDSQMTIGRPHIAKLLVEKDYVPDVASAFQLYLGDGKKCYVPGVALSVSETLDIIHESNGLAILAHPHLFRNYPFVKSLLALPFDGIESEYARMTPEQNEPWISLAKQKNLLRTGGSDFHGALKADLDLGATAIAWEHFEPLLMHFKIHHNHLI